jgi:type 1 glutamine amidotransferase
MQDLGPFETTDELYLSDFTGDVDVLLHARFAGEAPHFVRSKWDDDDPMRPVMYLHRFGDGEVLYLTLGHCQGHYDLQPRYDYVDVIDGSWDLPVYRTLLERGIAWACDATLE